MRIWIYVIAALILGSSVGLGMSLWEFFSARDDYGLLAPDGRPSTTSKTARTNENPPRCVVVDGLEHDFGVMDVKAKGSHLFTFKNEGSSPLLLTAGPTSCKCFFADLAEHLVAPGESVEVKLEWEPDGASKKFVQTADILTNDPERPVVRLEVRGWVTQRLRADPPAVSFGSIVADEEATTAFDLFSYYDDRFDITDVQWMVSETADMFSARWEPLLAEEIAAERHAKFGVRVFITLKPGLPLGHFDQTIRLATDLDQAPPIEVALGGDLTGDISVVASSRFFVPAHNLLKLGVIPTTEEKTVRLFVLVRGPRRDETTLEIGQIAPELLDVRIEPPETINNLVVKHPVVVKIPRGSEPVSCLGSEQGPLGKIILRTNHPQAPEIPLRVEFAVQ